MSERLCEFVGTLRGTVFDNRNEKRFDRFRRDERSTDTIDTSDSTLSIAMSSDA